jgi:hypothetical protein
MSETSQRDLGESDSPIEDELEDAFTRITEEGSQRLHRSWREVLATGFFGGTEVAMGYWRTCRCYTPAATIC